MRVQSGSSVNQNYAGLGHVLQAVQFIRTTQVWDMYAVQSLKIEKLETTLQKFGASLFL
jgi:hypothetical protein